MFLKLTLVIMLSLMPCVVSAGADVVDIEGEQFAAEVGSLAPVLSMLVAVTTQNNSKLVQQMERLNGIDVKLAEAQGRITGNSQDIIQNIQELITQANQASFLRQIIQSLIHHADPPSYEVMGEIDVDFDDIHMARKIEIACDEGDKARSMTVFKRERDGKVDGHMPNELLHQIVGLDKHGPERVEGLNLEYTWPPSLTQRRNWLIQYKLICEDYPPSNPTSSKPTYWEEVTPLFHENGNPITDLLPDSAPGQELEQLELLGPGGGGPINFEQLVFDISNTVRDVNRDVFNKFVDVDAEALSLRQAQDLQAFDFGIRIDTAMGLATDVSNIVATQQGNIEVLNGQAGATDVQIEILTDQIQQLIHRVNVLEGS